MSEFFINGTKDRVWRVELCKDVPEEVNNPERWLVTVIDIVDFSRGLGRRFLTIEQYLCNDEDLELRREGYASINAESFRNFLLTDCVDIVKKMDL